MAMFDVRIIAKSLEHLKALGELHPDLKYRVARQEDRNRFVVPGTLSEDDIQTVGTAGSDDDNQTTHPDQTFLNPAFDGKRGNLGDPLYREFIRSADEIKAVGIATRMNQALAEVRGRKYTVQQGAGLYPTSATSSDYVFSRHQADAGQPDICGFTIEFGEEFVPPFNEM
jgi:murein tripeptide amidase MpaA